MNSCPECSGPMPLATGIGRPRRFCTEECRKLHWGRIVSAANRTGARDNEHLLSDIDPVAGIGTCARCGAGTKVYGSSRQDGTRRWRCAAKVKAQASRAKMPDPVVERLRKLQQRGVIVTQEQLDRLESVADGRCSLCHEPSRLHLDHCYTTGHARALLCSTCNTGLGKFGDDPARLRAAAKYLERRGARDRILEATTPSPEIQHEHSAR